MLRNSSIFEISTFTLQAQQERLVANLKADEQSRTERQQSSNGFPTGKTALTNRQLKDVCDSLEKDVASVFNDSSVTVKELISNINASAKEKIGKGFGKFQFGFGVANLLLMVFMFGYYPQHFWILYIAESIYFFPFRLYIDWKTVPLRTVLYEMEYCWCVNFAIFILFCVFALGGTEAFPNKEASVSVFLMLIGTACGPLLAATMVLPIPLLFHSVDIMSSFFIHFFPPALLYTFRWRSFDILKAWPNHNTIEMVKRSNFWPTESFTRSIFGVMMIQYFTWFVLYSTWQITIGIDLPRKNRRTKTKNGISAPAVHDTSFHANMRDGMCQAFGRYIWKRSEAENQRMIDENDFELRDFAIYMILHFVGMLGSLICLAWPCYHSQTFHAIMLVIAMLVVVCKGAFFYNNVMTEVYADIVQESVESEIRKLMISESNKIEKDAYKGEQGESAESHFDEQLVVVGKADKNEDQDEIILEHVEEEYRENEHQELIEKYQN